MGRTKEHMGRTKERAWRNTDTHIWKKQKTATQTFKAPFRSDDAEERYNNFTSKRTLFMERGFTWLETNPLITQFIKSHKWETFGLNPYPASIPLVKEFYANYDSTKPDKVYVRGKLVDITSSAINSFFSLTNHQNTFCDDASDLSSVTVTDILNVLTEPGTELTRGLNNDMSFQWRYLKAGPKIWIEFIKHNLVPSCHDIIVEKDIAVLLYCIMVGKPINVGKVIAEQIGVCASLNEDELWFPDFITRLCKRDNVFLSDLERVQQPYSPLTFESESDQETSQLDHDSSSSYPVTNLSYDDGDEELLDVTWEPLESVENVSPMSDCLQSGILCVYAYKVKQSVAPILKSILKKHGDIASECVFKSVSVRSSLLEVICEVVRQIQTDSITDKMEEIEGQVSDAEAANINVSWLRAHLEGIHKRKEYMKKSSLLMETKGATILVKKAAQMDLRERCEELLAAQELFVTAKRCMRVLGLVEKKLSNNILESKAEKNL